MPGEVGQHYYLKDYLREEEKRPLAIKIPSPFSYGTLGGAGLEKSLGVPSLPCKRLRLTSRDWEVVYPAK